MGEMNGHSDLGDLTDRDGIGNLAMMMLKAVLATRAFV